MLTKAKYVFFDVDGTLVSHTAHKVPDSAREAIDRLQAGGIQCGLATGRHMIEMRELPGYDIAFDNYVMLNGQILLDKKRNLIDGLPLCGQIKESLLELFREGRIPVHLMEEDDSYINLVNEDVRQVLYDVSSTPPPVKPYQGGEIYMAVCYVPEAEQERLKDLLTGCRITRWHPAGIDIIAKSGGKAGGIERLIRAGGADFSEVVVFGDSENDIDMIREAGLGIAMGNADQEVKEAADYVTASVDEDGIYKALKHFGII